MPPSSRYPCREQGPGRDEVGASRGVGLQDVSPDLGSCGLLGAGDRCDRYTGLGVTSTISSFTAFTLGPKGRGQLWGPKEQQRVRVR